MPGQYSPKKLLLILILLLVLVVGVYWLMEIGNRESLTPAPGITEFGDDYVITHTNLAEAQSEQDRLPSGFPANIPVELESVSESYVIQYEARGATQYTISFSSNSTMVAKFQEYRSFMEGEGYELTAAESDDTSSFLYGVKDNNDLSIVISPREDGSYVQLSYVQRN